MGQAVFKRIQFPCKASHVGGQTLGTLPTAPTTFPLSWCVFTCGRAFMWKQSLTSVVFYLTHHIVEDVVFLESRDTRFN